MSRIRDFYKERIFYWQPQWFYSWPIKLAKGEDENGWRTIGVITWAGSIFYRTKICYDPECIEAREEYWKSRDLDD